MPDPKPTGQNAIVSQGYAPMMIRRPIGSDFAGNIHRITGYRENGQPLSGSLEMAPLVIPLIISFGEPFEIGLGRTPTRDDTFTSFTSGLYPGYVSINSTGRAECIQIDFTPLGAYRFFGLPMREISNRMVTLDDLADKGVAELSRRLGEERGWNRRFALVEAFLRRRLRGGPSASAPVAWAYRTILSSRGALRVSTMADELGWSRKHLNDRFCEEVGIGPKVFTRMVRFNHALAMARHGTGDGWAAIAIDCGYADQAHLAREFRTFAGMTPTAVARAAG